ncbi:chromosome segregation protein SMC [Chlamydiota bacterium]
MYLKKIEIAGFKSFAKRTIIDLEHNITAIIGPNGCGKSNVVDALKWVLGEQNPRLMRGAKMDDIIFNGTDEKKPVGRAEVTITFENVKKVLDIDFSEVSVTRRLYRSGDSEYLINQTPCRLKDIREYFMGTGIGTSAYSVLEQGNVDLVLSSKPEDRRFVFEEAAGISKYKAKKKESLSKLESVETNLSRISDIIKEVKRQKGSLERQAGRARRYKEYKDELKSLEIYIAQEEHKKLENELSGIQKKKRGIQSSQDTANTELSSLKSEMVLIEQDIDDLSQELNSLHNKKIQLEYTANTNKQHITNYSNQIQELESQTELIKQEISSFEKRLQETESNVKKITQTYAYLDKKEVPSTELLEKLSNMIKKSDTAILENNTLIDEKKAFIIDCLQKKAEYTNKIAVFKEQSKQQLLDAEKAETQKADLLERITQKKDKLAELLQEKNNQNEELIKVSASVKKMQETINSLQEKSKHLAESISTERQLYSEYDSRSTVIGELISSMEGFTDAVRLLLQQRKEHGEHLSLVGAVSELIIPQRNAAKAIESVLSDKLQHIIIQDNRNFESKIDYIQKNFNGKMTILSLASLKKSANRINKSILRDPDVIGPALKFVSCDEKYKLLLEHLLGNVVLVKNLDAILRIRKKQEHIHLVSLQGEIAYSDGSITCGVTEKTTIGLLERKTHLDLLLEQKNEKNNFLKILEKERAEIETDIGNSSSSLSSIAKELRDKEYAVSHIENNTAHLDMRINELKDRFGDVSTQKEEKLSLIATSEQKVAECEEQIEKVKHELETLEKEVFSRENQAKLFQKEREESMLEYTQLQIKYENFRQKEDEINLQKESLRKLYDDYKSMGERKQTELVQCLKKRDDFVLKIEELENESNSNETRLHEYDSKSFSLKERKKVFEILLLEKKDKEDLFCSSIEEKKDALHKHEMHETEFRLRCENVVARLYDKYSINLGDALAVKLDLDTVQAQDRIAEIKDYIGKIGPVDLVAIDEYDELKERFEFLVNQEVDLVTSKENLIKAINTINRVTKEMFVETFESVRTYFDEIFKKLFGGGKADLVLNDDTNILESGIEIVARPPGKKLRTITLLSGGEKAMTALSLLLALFKVRPSPFCIMDEMDAALDDSNIGRFIELLEEFTNNTQFILVTHNKKTISIAEIIYGVTMEEYGVSRIVSVKLQETKNKPATESISV